MDILTSNKGGSKEEMHIKWWLDELKEEGFVNEFTFDTKPYELSEPLIINNIRILESKIYTYDVYVLFNEKSEGYFITSDMKKRKKIPFINMGDNQVHIEVKGSYNHYNMIREFRIKQKWLYQKYKILVQLAQIPLLFKKTFVPQRYLLTDKTKVKRKINFKNQSLNDYVGNL